jgi:hypothetical protein
MPEPLSDLTNPITTAGNAQSTPARQVTQPLRETVALALLAGNAVFLVLGFSGLFFVIDRWATGFGERCAAAYDAFVGPSSLGLPLVAMLLATHVAPMVRRTRTILIAALAELGVSAFFGAITYLGAFANDLSSVRATVEGLLRRSVWLGFLVLACVVVTRVWTGLYPASKPQPAGYATYGQPTYGRPYPGQPMYPPPPPTYQPGVAQLGTAEPHDAARALAEPRDATRVMGQPHDPTRAMAEPSDATRVMGQPHDAVRALADEKTSGTGWPVVPPPPIPAPLVMPVDPITPPSITSPAGHEMAGDRMVGDEMADATAAMQSVGEQPDDAAARPEAGPVQPEAGPAADPRTQQTER